MTAPLPRWTHLDFRCVVQQVQGREVNVETFRQLQSVTCAARDCLQSDDPLCADFSTQVLEAVDLETGLHFEKQQLLEACRLDSTSKTWHE